MRKKVLLMCALYAGLLSCATTDDPRQGGLFSYDPEAYEKRLEQRRQILEELQKSQQAEQEKTQTLESEVRVKQEELEKQRERLSALDADLEKIQQEVSQYQAQTSVKTKEKEQIEKQIKQLKAQLHALQNNTQLSVAERETRIAQLKSEIDELLQLAAVLIQ